MSDYKDQVICRGSTSLGSGCRQCAKCKDELAGKISKAHGEPKSWFDMYLDLETKLTTRIYDLEKRVQDLESTVQGLNARTSGSIRIGGRS